MLLTHKAMDPEDVDTVLLDYMVPFITGMNITPSHPRCVMDKKFKYDFQGKDVWNREYSPDHIKYELLLDRSVGDNIKSSMFFTIKFGDEFLGLQDSIFYPSVPFPCMKELSLRRNSLAQMFVDTIVKSVFQEDDCYSENIDAIAVRMKPKSLNEAGRWANWSDLKENTDIIIIYKAYAVQIRLSCSMNYPFTLSVSTSKRRFRLMHNVSDFPLEKEYRDDMNGFKLIYKADHMTPMVLKKIPQLKEDLQQRILKDIRCSHVKKSTACLHDFDTFQGHCDHLPDIPFERIQDRYQNMWKKYREAAINTGQYTRDRE